jgi:aryl-alcohol dehydrogenase-like predicted oxidoreductase
MIESINPLTRRGFLKGAAITSAAAILPEKARAMAQNIPAPTSTGGQVPHRPMGKTGLNVSIIGLGGFHLGAIKDQKEATEIIARAMDAGINFFDNAWEYKEGLSEERLGAALEGKRDRAIVMTKVCTHGRDRKVAMQMLEESLVRLRTDHLDVWQIHEVVYWNDPQKIFMPNGVAEALLQAKKDGKVRFIGFTGHKDPAIHLEMLHHDFPFDTVQMPLNPFDATFRSFEKNVLPVANSRGMAVLGMKSMGGSGEMVRSGAITPTEALRYALSLPVSTTISGVDAPGVLEQNLEIALNFKPMTAAEMDALREHCKQYAADGRYERFKTTLMYDGDEGRKQHDFLPSKQLPA